MKARYVILSFFITFALLCITFIAQAQSGNKAENQNTYQEDRVKDLYDQSFKENSLRNDSLKKIFSNKKILLLKKYSSALTLSPDNMLAYIPENKNPDDMPLIRSHYGKTGGVDIMPNVYKGKIPDINPQKCIVTKQKSENNLSK